jgi:hypothetical protein
MNEIDSLLEKKFNSFRFEHKLNITHLGPHHPEYFVVVDSASQQTPKD